MSSISIDPMTRRRLQPARFARNGKLVAAEFQSELAHRLNQLVSRGRLLFRSTGNAVGIEGGKTWRWMSHLSPLAGSLLVRVIMAPVDTQSDATFNPRILLVLRDASGNLLKSQQVHFGYAFGRSISEAPDEWGPCTMAVSVSDIQDTLVFATVTASDEAHPVSCVAYEHPVPPDTDGGFVKQLFPIGSPILDSDRKAMHDLAHGLYRRGLGAVITYSSDIVPAPNTSSTTYENLFPPHFSTGRDHAAPFTVDLRGMNRRTKTGVPVRVSCFAGMDAAGTGSVRLVDTLGNFHNSWSVEGAAAWQSVDDIELPPERRSYVIEHSVPAGGDTLTTYALSAIRYSP